MGMSLVRHGAGPGKGAEMNENEPVEEGEELDELSEEELEAHMAELAAERFYSKFYGG